MEKDVSRKRRNAEELLEAGLDLLAAGSVAGLTIDSLCRKLGVTKGSFYHHFRNRDEFLEKLLKHWVEKWTDTYLSDAEAGLSAVERYERLVNSAENHPMEHETSIRVWAQRDNMAREYLERVDKARVDYLRSIFKEICGDDERADILAHMDYSLFVGTRMITPPVVGTMRQKILKLLQSELYAIKSD